MVVELLFEGRRRVEGVIPNDLKKRDSHIRAGIAICLG